MRRAPAGSSVPAAHVRRWMPSWSHSLGQQLASRIETRRRYKKLMSLLLRKLGDPVTKHSPFDWGSRAKRAESGLMADAIDNTDKETLKNLDENLARGPNVD